MKAVTLPMIGAIALAFCLAACATADKAPVPRPAPVARPAPATAPSVAPRVAQSPVSDAWIDAPATPGTWRYQINAGGPAAVFIASQGLGEFVMSCDQQGGPISFWRAGGSAAPKIMTVRTETATRSFQVVQAEDTNPYLTTRLTSNDPLLDAMALSKGRFAIEIEGLRTLYLPSHAEVSRVIEDCR